MFTVNVNNSNLKFRFFKEHLMRRNTEENWQKVTPTNGHKIGSTLDALQQLGVTTTYATNCVIEDSCGNELARGATVLNPHDYPDRFVGKKIAMTRAINSLSNHLEISKKDKKVIWNGLLEMMHRNHFE